MNKFQPLWVHTLKDLLKRYFSINSQIFQKTIYFQFTGRTTVKQRETKWTKGCFISDKSERFLPPPVLQKMYKKWQNVNSQKIYLYTFKKEVLGALPILHVCRILHIESKLHDIIIIPFYSYFMKIVFCFDLKSIKFYYFFCHCYLLYVIIQGKQ